MVGFLWRQTVTFVKIALVILVLGLGIVIFAVTVVVGLVLLGLAHHRRLESVEISVSELKEQSPVTPTVFIRPHRKPVRPLRSVGWSPPGAAKTPDVGDDRESARTTIMPRAGQSLDEDDSEDRTDAEPTLDPDQLGSDDDGAPPKKSSRFADLFRRS